MNLGPVILGSIFRLVELFFAENLNADVATTFAALKNATEANSPNLYWPTSDNVETYDFVIVGGGTAGSVVAGRLAEFGGGRWRIALLELGSDPPPQTFVPAFINSYFGHPGLSLRYTSAGNEETGFGGEAIFLGKVLGGTSQMNGMIFNRGNPLDYDQWAEVTGDSGWSYKNVVPHYKKMETWKVTNDDLDSPIDIDPSLHGFSGPITISGHSNVAGLSTWLEAGKELGIPTEDPNGHQRVSFSPFQLNKKDGRRDSPYNAYLGNRTAWPNLDILTYANVTQIIFDDEKRATGLVYQKHGVSFLIRAQNEIILSAGAFGTPQLLMRSGVGPREHLEELNIAVVSDLPVGENLQDHLSFNMPSLLLVDPEHVHGPATVDFEEAMENFLTNGTGPLTAAWGQIGQGFVQSSLVDQNISWPDIQFLVARGRVPIEVPTPPLNESLVSLTTVISINRPKSRGAVRLDPKNLNGDPIINHHFFSDPQGHDRQVTLEGITKIVEIFEGTEVYRKFQAKFDKPDLPVCDDAYPYRSEDWWWCYVKENGRTGNHHSGTCKMSNPTDSSAVVDPQLKVLGVKGLRIMDASVMPTVPNANIQAAVFLIGEKGADFIIKDWGNEKSI